MVTDQSIQEAGALISSLNIDCQIVPVTEEVHALDNHPVHAFVSFTFCAAISIHGFDKFDVLQSMTSEYLPRCES